MNNTDLEGFDEFWRIYPRRVAKLAAVRMYRRALKMATSAELLSGARQYAQEVVGKDVQFIAHPATWLNAGRWEDYKPVAPNISVSVAGFYAAFCSAELDAWNSYGRKTKGLNYPADRRGGWWFPTQWPPTGGQNARNHEPRGPQT